MNPASTSGTYTPGPYQSASPTPPKQPTSAGNALNALTYTEDRVNALAKVVIELTNRLSPVLSAPSPNGAGTEGAKAAGVSPVTGKVMELNENLHSIVLHVYNLIDRLEV